MTAELRQPILAPPLSLRGATTQLGSLDGACIEKLLVHCAHALEANDVTLAQQVMWVLNNAASLVGNPNQRLVAWFLRALISRLCPSLRAVHTRAMSMTELASYVDLIPWHRFGYCASNSAIFKAVQGCPNVHIIDFTATHCMQWPTLIDALAKRPEGPPRLRITIPEFRPRVPPLLNVSSEELGLRLGKFSKVKQVPFEFNVVSPESESGEEEFESLLTRLNPSSLGLRSDEALVVNFQGWLRYFPELRDTFLATARGLNPRLVVVVDEDAELSSPNLANRIAACFNYLWIPFDALDTFLAKESSQRIEYESDIGQKIENIIRGGGGPEGLRRPEMAESGRAFRRRMRSAGFSGVPFGDDTAVEVKGLLDGHASGWGLKREEDHMLVLTWKGHNSVFATAWVPS